MRKLLYLFIPLFCNIANAQVSGDLQLNANRYIRDAKIGAFNNELYDNLLFGGESWFTVNYGTRGFDLTVRYDLFTNSNLHNPQKAYSDHGLGFWSVKKRLDQLTATVGSFYDQFASGIVFRSYEDRGLGIDYAMQGLHLKYDFSDNWMIKGFVGRQKKLFSSYNPIVKGVNTERYFSIKDKIRLNVGGAFVNRTLDQSSMNNVVTNINALPLENRFYPKYNVYLYTFYNTIYYKKYNWYIEYAGKSKESILNENGNLIDTDGHVLYTTFTYSRKGLGATVQYKETEYFSFRTSPNELILEGVLNYLPSLTKLNTHRLLARYPAASLEWKERSVQTDIIYTPKKGNTITANLAYTNFLDGSIGDFFKSLSDTLLFAEINIEYEKKVNKKLHLGGGVQYIHYNHNVYQASNKPDVIAITPFLDILYKVKRRKSIRAELQYLSTDDDYGSWAYGLLEYSVAPKWSFSVLDMYLIKPNPKGKDEMGRPLEKIHYPTVFCSYNEGSNRFTIAYVKQVAGVVCTGGVCRIEPAFSGIRFTLNSTF